MIIIDDLLYYLGLKAETTAIKAPKKFDKYIGSTDLNTLKEHRDFLKELYKDEADRLTLLESKSAQIVSQTGIIFTLLSLFIPILIDITTKKEVDNECLLFIFLIVNFIFYVITINHGLKNLNIKNFIYSTPAPTNVLNHQSSSLDKFIIEEINDLLYSIYKNKETNNIKSDNIIYAYRNFRIANILTALFVALLFYSYLIK